METSLFNAEFVPFIVGYRADFGNGESLPWSEALHKPVVEVTMGKLADATYTQVDLHAFIRLRSYHNKF